MDKELADWLLGNVAGGHRYLDHVLLPLLKIHKVESAGENIAQALYALNRVSANIRNQIKEAPALPSTGAA